jgi:hypothetical protein
LSFVPRDFERDFGLAGVLRRSESRMERGKKKAVICIDDGHDEVEEEDHIEKQTSHVRD